MLPIEIDVVLATFNGGKFLREQLESVLSQKDVAINLYVSDDGSSDDTLKILDSYADKFLSFKLLNGPQLGPAENFFLLLANSKGDYVALADQDDIWEPDHLMNSIESLSVFNNTPALRFCSAREFGIKINERIWPSVGELPSFQILLMENQARGCTMVMNRKAVNEIVAYLPKNAVMHDWWILLQIYLKGKVLYSNVPEVNYRLHGLNAVGMPKKRGFKAFKSARDGTWAPMLQIKELFDLNQGLIPEIYLKTLSDFNNIPTLSFVKKFKKTLFRTNRLRTNLVDEIAVRLVLFFFRPNP